MPRPSGTTGLRTTTSRDTFINLKRNEGAPVERREIEIFLTLAEELHYGRTAERLLVTTARVSQTITRLERRFGARLFERTSRRVALTPVGSRLRDDLLAPFEQIEAAIERAMAAGREVQGMLRIGFFRAAAGRFVLEVAEAFQARHPDCDVQIRENPLDDPLGALRDDEVDLLFLMLPVEESDLVTGPVLVRETRMLAVSARHPLARRTTVTLDDLARDPILTAPEGLPAYVRDHLVPERTPSGKPVRRGPTFATIQEMLSLIGAGKGMYPVPAHTQQYYARPDVAYLPITDAPDLEWAFTWRRAAETRRIRAFDQCARDLASSAARATGFPDTPV
jgi:DNA-binding transcriptional LysR family regulator